MSYFSEFIKAINFRLSQVGKDRTTRLVREKIGDLTVVRREETKPTDGKGIG